MKNPSTWDDRTILEEEPLRTAFVAYSLSEPTRKGRATKGVDIALAFTNIAREIERGPGGKAAVRAWFKLAFAANEKESTETKRKVNKANGKLKATTIFVEFFWILYATDINAALLFLNAKRKEKGLNYNLGLRSARLGGGSTRHPAKTPMSGKESPTAVRKSPSPTGMPTPQAHRGEPMSPLTSPCPVMAVLPPDPYVKLEPDPMSIDTLREVSFVGISPSLSGGLCGRISGLETLEDGFEPPKIESAEDSILPSAPFDSSLPEETPLPSSSAMTPSISGGPFILSTGLETLENGFEPKTESTEECILPSTHSDSSLPEETPLPPSGAMTPSFSAGPFSWLTGLETFEDEFEPPKTESTEDCILPSAQFAPVPKKLPLSRYPPIWAQSRQEVCEAFAWFRSYQGGVYSTNNIVRGYLLGAFSSIRDRFEHGGKLIISHGGGKSESLRTINRQTESQAADDQLAEDKSVRALLSTYREGRPLVLLMDDRYALFPYDLTGKGIYMAILGFYRIAHAWAEFQPAPSNGRGRVVRYKFAFQWCEDQGQPWWFENAPTSNGMTAEQPSIATGLHLSESSMKPVAEMSLSDLRPPQPDDLYYTCIACQRKTPQVYKCQWVCLNADCAKFWKTENDHPPPDELEYNENFLRLLDLPPPLTVVSSQQLYPAPPVIAPSNQITTTHGFSKGWHCRECGRLSCRYAWEAYECSHCKRSLRIEGRVQKAKELWMQVPVKFVDNHIYRLSGIERKPTVMYSHERGLGHFQTFILPNGRGRIHHIQPGQMGKQEADRIFEEYQKQASEGRLLFRRWPLRSHKLRTPLLTNYFSQNSGETYHYVGGTDNTVPFDQAPRAVVDARKLIQDRVKQALNMEYNFNEVLSAAYIERQKMAFHSDSERGLGNVVAGLSLGSPALMHFRLHAKHQPPDSIAKIAMSFVLRHGDVLVMEGAGVQQYYEHAVAPCNFRIAATARWIDPKHS